MTLVDIAALSISHLPYWKALMLQAILDNPVRLYSIAVAAVALVAFYVTIPAPLILGLIAAVLGVGEGVRSQVAPMSKVVLHVDDYEPFDFEDDEEV